jgi:hypothetical protein
LDQLHESDRWVIFSLYSSLAQIISLPLPQTEDEYQPKKVLYSSVPHTQINLESDFERVMDYLLAKGIGQLWRFFCLERGVKQLADLKRPHILD